MSDRNPTSLTAVPAGPVPCVRYPGHRPGEHIHPEGICACFHGGPAPIRALTELDLVLRQAALDAARFTTPRAPRLRSPWQRILRRAA